MRIITRAEWGAKLGDGKGPAPLPAREVYLHHSVTIAPDLVAPWDDDYAAVRTLERIGGQRFGAAYGLSYTFVITPAGLIFEGHDVAQLGAHTGGRNSIARAICWVGDYETMRPTEMLIDTTAALLRHGHRAGWWVTPRLTGGHRDAPGASTACPGRHAHAVIGEINARAAGDPTPRTLLVATPMMRGEDIRTLQGSLNRVFPSYSRLDADGWYGPATAAVITEFQRRVGLAADGIVGPNTWTALRRYGI